MKISYPVSILFSVYLFCLGKADVKPKQASPNIVFIIADDMGWDVFGKHPNTNGIKAKTPILDSLSATGLVFNNFWSNPECSPTRAAMLTGRYGFRTGVGAAAGVLKNNETIIQKYIDDKKPHTYANAVIGKWHVSRPTQLTAPKEFGVGYYSTIMEGAVKDYYDWTVNTNGIQQNITTYSTTHLVNESITWINRQKTPFFLWLAFNAPHTPFHLPPKNLITNKNLSDSQSAISANPLLYYIAAIEAMDTEIGRLIAAIPLSQRENTVFVFLGDNGTPPRVAQQPFSPGRAKSTLYQGGINTPLIVSGKNITRKSEAENALLQATDIFATIADIAGVGSATYQDSKSFKSLFTATNANYRNYAYSELFGSKINKNDGYTLRNEHYKLIHLTNANELFFDLKSDPFERKNLLLGKLSDQEQQNLSQLRAKKEDL